ncbi:zeta toxin family protein [Streptomyces sp. NBC_00441]|uniref:zeta toxin family protein n=1 Tax=Streptomyces sp. NBC_00441 TaxID=2975742 RepID=UPI002E28E66F|nr:zeta toxin family protein [Streptomyces sp. NBC_00441]
MSDELYPRLGSDRENARVFNRHVRPRITGTPRENPNVLFIGGTPGSGKTTAQDTLLSRLGRTDSFSLDGDELILQHPQAERLHREGEFTGAYLASEALKGHWWSRAARLLRMQRLDTVISAPLAGPQWAIKRITEFRRADFQVGVAFVATHKALSLQGVVDRYHRNRQLYGYGRWIPPQWHDAAYSGVLDTADQIDALRAADTIYVARRDGTLLHTNQLSPKGAWSLGLATSQAIEAERNRPWTATESSHFLQKQGQLRRELSAEWTPLLDSIDRRAMPAISPLVVRDDVQLAAHRAETEGLLQRIEHEAATMKSRSGELGRAHHSGENATRLKELREAGAPAAELRQIRETMHQDRWNANITEFNLGRRIAGTTQLLERTGQEQQRRGELAPAERLYEDRARQHLQALAANQPVRSVPTRNEGPRLSGPEGGGRRQGW